MKERYCPIQKRVLQMYWRQHTSFFFFLVESSSLLPASHLPQAWSIYLGKSCSVQEWQCYGWTERQSKQRRRRAHSHSWVPVLCYLKQDKIVTFNHIWLEEHYVYLNPLVGQNWLWCSQGRQLLLSSKVKILTNSGRWNDRSSGMMWESL